MSAVEVHRVVIRSSAAIVVAQFAAYRHLATAGFYAVVVGPCTDWLPVVIATEDLRPGPRWEFRTSGLWAEQVHERPTATTEHWSYGLEAFAIRIENPRELLGRGYGDRCALGWELDVFTPIDDSIDGQALPGSARGVLLFERLELDVDGPAWRYHWQLEPEDVNGDAAAPMLTTTVDATTSVGSSPSVIVPTALGEWTVAIADRPTSG